MYFILKLTILLEILLLINKCKAYVLHTTLQEKEENKQVINNNLMLQEITSNPSYNYIDNMVIKPQEIREPTALQEIVNYVGADKLSNTAVLPDVNNNQHTLSYGKLAELLAFWQWDKEHNFYEMQTESEQNTNDNFFATLE